MSARILYGKEFAAKIKESARREIEELKKNFGVTPGLSVIIVGENPASQVYVRNKHKTCEELGIRLTRSTPIKIFTAFWFNCRCPPRLKLTRKKF